MEEKRLFWATAINCVWGGCGILAGISSLLGLQFLMLRSICFICTFLVFLLAAYRTKCMSGVTLMKNTLVSMALSLLIGQENSLAKVSAIVMSCALTIYVCLFIVRCIQTKRRTGIGEYILNGRLIIGLCLCLTTGMTIGNSLSVLFYEKIPEYQIQAKTEVSKLKDVSLEQNLDSLFAVVNPSDWNLLSDEEKIECFQTICNIERTYQNLPYDLKVVATYLDEYTRGQYDPQTHTIEINELLLHQKTGIEGMETVCHEARHAYQHALVSLLGYVPAHLQELEALEEAAVFSSEFENYATEGTAYYTQNCEEDAREYAKSAVNEYLYRILEYGEKDQRYITNDEEAYYGSN